MFAHPMKNIIEIHFFKINITNLFFYGRYYRIRKQVVCGGSQN